MTDQFEWDQHKHLQNMQKHGVSFWFASRAFFDPKRIIAVDTKHSGSEKRYYCFGMIEGEILTVRFTRRHNRIRIIGAGYWRKGKKAYEEKNSIH